MKCGEMRESRKGTEERGREREQGRRDEREEGGRREGKREWGRTDGRCLPKTRIPHLRCGGV